MEPRGGRFPALKVSARTSAFAFRGSDLDIRTIADSLGVEHVLEGSVRRSLRPPDTPEHHGP